MDIELENILEAILFASDEPLILKDILSLKDQAEFESYELTEEKLESCFEKIQSKYQSSEYILELQAVSGGYQFNTKDQYAPFIEVVYQDKKKKKLSKSALETLSIITYKQPITKAEIEYIRGVNCDYAVQKLLKQQLIEPGGRSDLPGKPLLYKTSLFFLKYFGLNSLQDLPKLKEIGENTDDINEISPAVVAEENKKGE